MGLPQLKGRIERNYPLKKLNTWKIGGPGEIVFWPKKTEDLLQAVNWCKKSNTPVNLLGHGSNVLIPDNGLRGMIIVTTELRNINWQENTVTVEAGYPLMRLAREAAERGLGGLEFASGIPGTVGGAVVINAGAYGGEIGNLVKQVKVMTKQGKLTALDKEQISFSYRNSSLLTQELWVLECSMSLEYSDSENIKQTMKTLMEKRKKTQPLEYPNAGSVFRNPPGDSAGRLIEEAGWKGFRIGDAQVSEKHANFIINRGKATAVDVLELIKIIQNDIQEKYDIWLEPEIKIVG